MEGQFGQFAKNMRDMAEILQEAYNSSIDPLNAGHSLKRLVCLFTDSPEKIAYYQHKYYMDMAVFYMCPERKSALGDHRFTDPKWQDNHYYRNIRDIFLFNAKFLMEIVDKESESLSAMERKRVMFISKLIVEACSPSNSIFLNPEFIMECVTTKGKNLINGLENFLEDCHIGRITTAASNTFVVGEDVASTKGNVVFRNYLFELIHYKATTEKIHAIPLLIIPPWINKYYILDMRPENSFVKWLVDSGYDVYIMSWVNPNKSMRCVNFDNYVKDGALKAWQYVVKHHQKVQLIGYCLGGTLTTILLSILAARKLDHKVISATLLATLIDFSDVGDFAILMSDDQLRSFEIKVRNRGYVSGLEMYYVFSLMRSRDMIWKTIVERYVLGRNAPQMDILAWNSDTTNLPAEMSIDYLRNFYRDNNLIKPNHMTADDTPVDIRIISTPSFCVAAAKDHIVPWQTAYSGALRLPNTKFVLSDSGHIAGIINTPLSNKYCFWVNDNLDVDPNVWLQNARCTQGSWWPEWLKWNQQFAGPTIKKRAIPERSLCKAPGTYVHKDIW